MNEIDKIGEDIPNSQEKIPPVEKEIDVGESIKETSKIDLNDKVEGLRGQIQRIQKERSKNEETQKEYKEQGRNPELEAEMREWEIEAKKHTFLYSDFRTGSLHRDFETGKMEDQYFCHRKGREEWNEGKIGNVSTEITEKQVGSFFPEDGEKLGGKEGKFDFNYENLRAIISAPDIYKGLQKYAFEKILEKEYWNNLSSEEQLYFAKGKFVKKDTSDLINDRDRDFHNEIINEAIVNLDPKKHREFLRDVALNKVPEVYNTVVNVIVKMNISKKDKVLKDMKKLTQISALKALPQEGNLDIFKEVIKISDSDVRFEAFKKIEDIEVLKNVLEQESKQKGPSHKVIEELKKKIAFIEGGEYNL